jgi:hypothetical protein
MRVSLPLTIERGRLRVALVALCAIAVLAVAAAGSAAPANAAITGCQNGAPTGNVAGIGLQGSSLQGKAVEFWNSKKIYLSENLNAFGCGTGAGVVTYTSKSSGCGLDSMGAGIAAEGCSLSGTEKNWEEGGYRDKTVRIGATDFAPDPAEETRIDDGPAGGQHAGKIHVLPVASAAIAVVVHFPAGCTLANPAENGGNDDATTGAPNDPAGLETTDSAVSQSLRVHIPAQALEEIWEHKITKWGEIPTPEGVSTLAHFMTPESSCAATPIFRIARFDTSGTSFNFKAYLSLLPSFGEDGGTHLWKEGQVGSTNNAWPLADASHPGIPAVVAKTKEEQVTGETGAKVTAGNAEECTTTISPNQICRAAAEGGGSLAKAVNATNGSIGYLDVATARKESFTIETSKNDVTYWLPLQAVNPELPAASRIEHPTLFFEPTLNPKAHFTTTVTSEKGANCEEADYRGIPTTPASDPTLGDWSNAIATGGGAYPICAITYDLAFDDDAPVYGEAAPEEEAARTVKEYLTSVVSIPGQTLLPEFDYGTLPNTSQHPILTDAENGVAAIGWAKSAGSGGGGGGGTVTPPPTVAHVVTPPGVAVTPAPSNSFSVASAKVKGKNIVLSLVLPGAGKVQIKAAGGGVTVSNVTAGVSGGQGTVTLPISGAALKKLAKAKSKKLSVSITVTFTPTGGTAATQTKTLTITQASIASKPKKKSKKKGKKG